MDDPLLPDPAADHAHGRSRRSSIPWIIITMIAVSVMIWQWLETRNRLGTTQEELAKRLADADAAVTEARLIARQNSESLQALTAKLGALDAKVAESQSQQVALEALYQEIGRNKDDRLVAEVDQLINAAVQQLQLSANVGGALVALQTADQRLAASDRPQFIPLRKAITHDIDQLKALPNSDITGMSLHLEAVVSAVDKLPLVMEQRPPAEYHAAGKTPAEKDFWTGIVMDIWAELRQLVRISRLDRPDPGLLAPEQSFFMRENLKLRLLNARVALLQRDERTFREEVRQAQTWIGRYFDGKAKSVLEANNTLQKLAETRLTIELPTLNDTQTALRNVKLRYERPASDAAAKARGG